METRATTTAATTAATAEVEAATASVEESFRADGRPDPGAAVARTEELYARHGRLVSGLCRALLRDRAEAEDAAQQTFLAAHRALVNGTTPREPAAWLATIARNECWARVRARMREPLPADELEAESHTGDPLTQAIRRADLAALWQAIAELPRQQRDALLLREFGGLTYTELAEALAVTGPAVESLLFRARQGLRARLETAYAAFSGASLVEALTRLLAGASGSAAPVVAKTVAAAGVGAVLATGGVVVAPHVLEHHPPLRHHVVPARPPSASRTFTPVAQVLSKVAPVAVQRTVVQSPRVARSGEHGSVRGDSGSGDSGGRSSGSGDGRAGSGSGGSGDERQRTVAGSGDRHAGGSSGRDGGSDGGSRDSGGGGSEGSTSGSGSGGGGETGSAGGDGGGDHSSDGAAPQPQQDGGGVTVPVTNPPLPIIPPPADPVPGDDG